MADNFLPEGGSRHISQGQAVHHRLFRIGVLRVHRDEPWGCWVRRSEVADLVPDRCVFDWEEEIPVLAHSRVRARIWIDLKNTAHVVSQASNQSLRPVEGNLWWDIYYVSRVRRRHLSPGIKA